MCFLSFWDLYIISVISFLTENHNQSAQRIFNQ